MIIRPRRLSIGIPQVLILKCTTFNRTSLKGLVPHFIKRLKWWQYILHAMFQAKLQISQRKWPIRLDILTSGSENIISAVQTVVFVNYVRQISCSKYKVYVSYIELGKQKANESGEDF